MYFRQKFVTQKSRAVRSASGFTLIELLMVIAVILILAGITFGISRGVQNAQARAKAKAELAIIAQGLEQFKSTYGDYPWIAETTTDSNANLLLQALTGWRIMERVGTTTSLSDVLATQRKSFIDPEKLSLTGSIPSTAAPTGSVYLTDPWGSAYVYAYKTGTWDNFGYLLYSEGPDSDSASLPTGGVPTQSWRNDADNIDNIYVGE